MGMTLVQFLLALVLPVVVAVVGMGLVIGLVYRRAVADGLPIQRPNESEAEWTSRLREQIESDRAKTKQPRETSG
jgi:Na+/H+ antiporter NhaD/arsenite permease-like protein